MECLEAAGFPPRDINQVALTNELELNMMSVKSLASEQMATGMCGKQSRSPATPSN